MPKQNSDCAAGRVAWLRKRAEYAVCYEKGRRFFTAHFIVFILPTDGEDCRVGISVSKKVGTAVHRNRYKRVLRAFFRLNAALLPRSTDLVIVVKKQRSVQTGLGIVCAELCPFFCVISR